MPLTPSEEAEEKLIKSGGVHPFPWRFEDSEYIAIYDDNGSEVGQVVSVLIARRIVELMNAHRVVFLEDEIVY